MGSRPPRETVLRVSRRTLRLMQPVERREGVASAYMSSGSQWAASRPRFTSMRDDVVACAGEPHREHQRAAYIKGRTGLSLGRPSRRYITFSFRSREESGDGRRGNGGWLLAAS